MSRTRETAVQLDSAIDALLRGPVVPAAADEGELTATARLLRDALPRLHPRFSFEEHLAARLAAARRLATRPGPTELPEPTPLRPALAFAEPGSADVDQDAPHDPGEASVADHRRRGLVAGGAIASGVSLAGAALVVWRRTRSSGGLF
jgi:hypothetical protein